MERTAWWRRPGWRGGSIVLCVLALSACLPFPMPSTVSRDEGPGLEPAPLNEPTPSELLDCVSGHLVERRADLRLAEAGPVWAALPAAPEQDISIEALLADPGACQAMEAQRVDYLVTVQHVQASGSKRGGILTVLYGMPHGPAWRFGYADHGLLAIVYRATGEVCERVHVKARARAGAAVIGPFLPGPFLIVFPVGDPASKACEALGEALSEAIPPSEAGAPGTVLVFEAGPPPETLSPWPEEQAEN